MIVPMRIARRPRPAGRLSSEFPPARPQLAAIKVNSLLTTSAQNGGRKSCPRGHACNHESSPTTSPTLRARTSRRAIPRCCAPRPSCSCRISPMTRTRSAATRNWRSISCRRCRSKCGPRSPSVWRSCADAPHAVIRVLARDIFQVAAPVIRRSPVLDSFDLLSVIAATDVEHHRLIARRSDLGEDVKRALRLTGDAEVTGYLDNGPAMRAAPARGRRRRSARRRSGGPRRPPPDRGGSSRFDIWQFLDLDRPTRLRVIADIAMGPPIPRPAAATGRRRPRLSVDPQCRTDRRLRPQRPASPN